MNQSPQARALCILSFDGGGIRGLSSLLILREIMNRINWELAKHRTSHTDLRPWQVFDVICGTSTGGLIAIMLGRLRMSVEQAIGAYNKLARGIFSETKWWWKEGRYKATNLEQSIMPIVGEYGVPDPQHSRLAPGAQLDQDARNADIGRNVMMLDTRADGDNCRVFPDRLRTYNVSRNPSPNCAIWEAARATSAAPSFFKPAVIKQNGLDMRYVDGGLRCNNPTKQVLAEAAECFDLNRQVACILSLGTGQKNTIHLPKAGFFPKLQLLKVVTLLQKIATDCEEMHQELAERQQLSEVYFRFNVDQGMQGIGLEEYNRMQEVGAHTRNYLLSYDCNKNVDRAVAKIVDRQGSISVGRAAGRS
ncbi:hypothetical protein FRC10_010160 [Ceratobasidium sp. 414]|nr:hypothetical protein FRC10_010160 [Ceratobasidium sp. 414]